MQVRRICFQLGICFQMGDLVVMLILEMFGVGGNQTLHCVVAIKRSSP